MTAIEQAAQVPSDQALWGMVLVGEDAAEKAYELTRHDDARPIGEIRSDFDGTFSVNRYGDVDNSSWGVAREFMHPDNRMKHIALYKKYSRYEKAGTFTEELAHDWNANANLLLEGIPYNDYVRTLIGRTALKRGAHALLDRAGQAGIPVEFVSTGFEQTIKDILSASRISLRGIAIYANRLHIDNDGIITGADADRIIHSKNKHLYPAADEGSSLADETADNRMDIILGDRLHDSGLADRDAGDSFIIRADGGREHIIAQHGIDGYRQFLRQSREAGYDAVTIGSTLLAPTRLLKRNLEVSGTCQENAA